jgi:hypothetical protein
MCRAVPFRVISRRSDMGCVVRQFLGSEDTRLVDAVEGLTLEKAVDAVNFELEAVNMLFDLDASCLRLGARHLQGNQMLLVALLRVDHPALKAAAATFHPIGETGLHLLELIEDKADGRIDGVGGGIGGIGGLGAVGVVIGVGLHDRSG